MEPRKLTVRSIVLEPTGRGTRVVLSDGSVLGGVTAILPKETRPNRPAVVELTVVLLEGDTE